MATKTTDTAEFDPVLSEIIYNYELTMNREMGRALVNLSGSFLFVSASDFACGCLDAEGRILTSIAWTLQMGYSISNTVRASLQRFADDLHPGDVIFANDPYDGGGLHSHDVVVVAPVFDEERLIMWVGVSAHVTDVGGAEPGGFAVEPMDVYGENVRFTPVKFYERGQFRADILDAFLTNTRAPKQTGIDLKALMGAVWIGRGRLGELIAQHGGTRIEAIHAGQIDASGRAFRRRLAQLPDGIYQGASHMEHDGANDRIYTIRATVTKRGEDLAFDYGGTDPESIGAINCTEVGGVGAVMAALGTVLAPDIPFNEGLMETVEVHSPKGTLMNAVKPAPISAATVYAGWFGTDAILEALNYLIAGDSQTSQRRTGPWGCWTFAWLQGPNQYGEPWFWNVFTGGAGGAGALEFRDGESAMMGIQTVDAFAPNVEEYELMSPVLFLQTGLAPDTGGVGRYRGGLAPETLCTPYESDGWDVDRVPESNVGSGVGRVGRLSRGGRGDLVRPAGDGRCERPAPAPRAPADRRVRAARRAAAGPGAWFPGHRRGRVLHPRDRGSRLRRPARARARIGARRRAARLRLDAHGARRLPRGARRIRQRRRRTGHRTASRAGT